MTINSIIRSREALRQRVWPLCEEVLGGGRLMSNTDHWTEEDELYVARELDVRAGIDELQILPSGAMRGLACRVQYTESFDSFTIRAGRESGRETEYHKRRAAIANNWIYPQITIQAYISEGYCVYGAIETRALYSYIDQAKEAGRLHAQRAAQDGTLFYVAYWDELEELGYDVIRGEGNCPIRERGEI